MTVIVVFSHATNPRANAFRDAVASCVADAVADSDQPRMQRPDSTAAVSAPACSTTGAASLRVIA